MKGTLWDNCSGFLQLNLKNSSLFCFLSGAAQHCWWLQDSVATIDLADQSAKFKVPCWSYTVARGSVKVEIKIHWNQWIVPLLETESGTSILVFCAIHLQTRQESTTDLTKGFGRYTGMSRRPLALQGLLMVNLETIFRGPRWRNLGLLTWTMRQGGLGSGCVGMCLG